MNKLLITLALITGLFSTQSWSADFNKGFIAYDSGDFETAINEWTPLAHDGDAEAQFGLGVIFQDDHYVHKDVNNSVKWFVAAGQQGHIKAQVMLGMIYLGGAGKRQDYEIAAYWFARAAKQEHVAAEYALGKMHRWGLGSVSFDRRLAIEYLTRAAIKNHGPAQIVLGKMLQLGEGNYIPNTKLSIELWEIAAKQGFGEAMYLLGLAYHYGRGVSVDHIKAMSWYKLAAAKETPEINPLEYITSSQIYRSSLAQFSLASMYQNGEGIPQDLVYSYMWYKIAADNDYERYYGGSLGTIEPILEVLSSQMNKSQIEEAQILFRKCLGTFYKGC